MDAHGSTQANSEVCFASRQGHDQPQGAGDVVSAVEVLVPVVPVTVPTRCAVELLKVCKDMFTEEMAEVLWKHGESSHICVGMPRPLAGRLHQAIFMLYIIQYHTYS